jgi:hypothetical protein
MEKVNIILSNWLPIVSCLALVVCIGFIFWYIFNESRKASEYYEVFFVGQFEFSQVYYILNRHKIVYNTRPVMNKENELVKISIRVSIEENEVQSIIEAYRDIDTHLFKTIEPKKLT